MRAFRFLKKCASAKPNDFGNELKLCIICTRVGKAIFVHSPNDINRHERKFLFLP